MKSQRKHELQTNELADALGRFIKRVKPHLQTIALAAAALIVVVVVLVVLPAIRGSTTDRAAAAFNMAQGIGDVQAVRKFLETYGDAPQAPTARLLLADRLVADVVSGMGAAKGAEPAAVAGMLDEAKRLYEQVAASSGLALKPFADVGLALVIVQQGDLDKGRAALQEVVTNWPQSLAAAKARAHVEALASYKPVAFSAEPLEAPPPAAGDEEAAPADATTGEVPTGPAEAAPAPAPETKPDAAPAEEPKAKPAEAEAKPVG
ncbi:MAG: hypothetical protein IMZ66_03855 [Planctomycetes bacterium]|nr:hypothetical protein [Planctomycetota bacterium]